MNNIIIKICVFRRLYLERHFLRVVLYEEKSKSKNELTKEKRKHVFCKKEEEEKESCIIHNMVLLSSAILLPQHEIVISAKYLSCCDRL